METRPTPTGWQHYVDVALTKAPEPRFTDSMCALSDIEGGLVQPLVEVIDQRADGSVVVRVSVFSSVEAASPSELASINGVIAELRYADADGVWFSSRYPAQGFLRIPEITPFATDVTCSPSRVSSYAGAPGRFIVVMTGGLRKGRELPERGQ